MTIDTSWVAQRNAAFLADPAARLAGNAVATTDVEQVSLDRTAVTSIDTSVSDLVPDASITDQKQSGRCWAFAGLNVLRASMLKELELDLPGAEPGLPLLLRQAGEGQCLPHPRHRRGGPPAG